MCLVLANVVGTVPQDDVHEDKYFSPRENLFTERACYDRKNYNRCHVSYPCLMSPQPTPLCPAELMRI